MSHIRILSYLAPRISQIVGWTFDTNSLTDPLLDKYSKPILPVTVYRAHYAIASTVTEYVPPPYKQTVNFPPDRLKRNFYG